ncbi:uncharacterized protein [Dysidea avara]|uniref:uncharacterized protein isoform X2 n=1 Tax=Dysidea avara TaxID=196820 RepID=UPI00332FD88F
MSLESRAGCAVLLLLLIGCCNGEVTITAHPVNITKCTEGIAVFQCRAEGNLSSHDLVWKKFITQSGVYKQLATGSRYKVFDSFDVERTIVQGALRIENVTTDDEGWYVFEIGSDVMSNRAYLNVITTADVVPVIIEVTSINSSMFTIYWTSSVVNANYTVIWTNLHTGVMYNRTVPGNTNSYTVTGLSGDVNYNVSVAAVNRCGMMTSDPVTVYEKLVDDDECSCTSLVGGVIAGFIGGMAVIMIIVIIILIVYWSYYNKKKGEPGNDQIVYNAVNNTHRDNISKDSISKNNIDLPVFKPQMTSHVIEDYSEVVNCARLPKAVCHKSASSRTKSNSDSIKEKLEETPVPPGSYETVTMNGNSSVPHQAIANGTEYALSTRMTPANVARTYSEPKKVDGVQQQQTDDVQQQVTTTGNGHLTTSNNTQQQQTVTSGNGHLTTNKISSSMAYEQVA